MLTGSRRLSVSVRSSRGSVFVSFRSLHRLGYPYPNSTLHQFPRTQHPDLRDSSFVDIHNRDNKQTRISGECTLIYVGGDQHASSWFVLYVHEQWDCYVAINILLQWSKANTTLHTSSRFSFISVSFLLPSTKSSETHHY